MSKKKTGASTRGRQKRLNLRLLLVLIVSGLVGGGAVYGLHRFQVGRLASKFQREATLAEREERFDDAERHLWRSVCLAPQKLDPYVRLANVLRWRLGRLDQADHWMERLVTLHPSSPRAHVLRGRYLLESARTEDANADAATALDLAPDDREALLLSARCSAILGQHDQASKYAARAVELYPRSADAYLTHADVEWRAGNRETALKSMRDGVKLTVGDRALLGNLVTLLLDEGDVGEAQGIVEVLAANPLSAPLAAYLQAKIDYTEGRWLAASRGFERARTDLALEPELSRQIAHWLADCYGRIGDRRRQLAVYERSVEVDPAWVPARLGLASALLSVGRLDDAIAEYRTLANAPNAPAAWQVQLAQTLVNKNLRMAPSKRDWQEVDEVLERVAQSDPASVRVALLRADVLLARNRALEAEELLRETGARDRESLEIRIALSSLSDRKGEWDVSKELLDEAERELGDSVVLRLARGRHLLRRREPDTAESLRKLSENTEQLPEREVPDLWRRLAWTSFRAGDVEHARQLSQRAAERDPKNLEIRLLMLDIAVWTGDALGLAAVLDEVQRIEGDGPIWHYGRALYFRLLALEDLKQEGLLEQAKEHLSQARALRPEWSRVPRLAAEIHDIEGHQDQAIDGYLEAIALGERNPRAVRRVVYLLSRRQRYSEADEIIRRLEEGQAVVPIELLRTASELSLRLGDPERALEIANRLAQISGDYRNHVWLAQVLATLGTRARSEQRAEESKARLGEAEAALRRAVELAADEPESWAALARFLSEMGETEKVERAIAEIREKVPEDRATLVLARCYEVIGKAEEADSQCEAALTAGSDDPATVAWVADFFTRRGKQAEAEELLRKIIAGQVRGDETLVLWARRRLATALSARGGYPRLGEAIDLIERNLAAAGSSVEDQRVKGVLLASHPKRARRREAIRILETVLPGQWAPVPEDRFTLARLYMAEGDWDKAAGQLKLLVDAHGSEPRYLAAYINTLFELGDAEGAESWLGRMEQVAAGQFAATGLRAEALLRRGRVDEAIKTLRAYLEAPNAQPKEQLARLSLVAAYLQSKAGRQSDGDQDGVSARFLAEAETMRRDHVEEFPEQEILIAPILGRQGRMEEALELAQRAWEHAGAGAIAQATSALQASGALGDGEMERIENILVAALKKHERAVSLLLALANVRIFQERNEEAEALFREAMEAGPGNVVAMNNLAVLLALQETRLTEAQQLIDEAIELGGPISHLLDSRATVYMATGKPGEALADLDAALAESPSATSYFHKAQVHYGAGEQEAAGKALAEAHQLGLTPEQLAPLERPAYRALKAALQ